MDLKTITFKEFLCRLKDDAEKYFECKCVAEHHNDEEILLEMANDLSDFDEERANDNFDDGYEQWLVRYLIIYEKTLTFNYRDGDVENEDDLFWRSFVGENYNLVDA